MTIIEATKEVLQNVDTGLTSKAIYNAIIEQKLYNFGALNPLGVVNGEIRRHCIDLNLPTASPAKYFCISGKKENKLLFSLSKKGENYNHKSALVNAINTKDRLPEEAILESYLEHLLQVEENYWAGCWKAIQAFVGAMSNVQEGVFITTSRYTKEAKKYAQSQQQKNLKLIDGKQLTEYIIKFGVGVECLKAFNIYKLDDDCLGH